MILFCNQASDLWQQPESAFELEADLRGTVDLGRKRKVVLFHWSNNARAI